MAGEGVGLELLEPGSKLVKKKGPSSILLEPALSDSLSEQEYSSSDSGKGSGSDTVTPPNSIVNEQVQEVRGEEEEEEAKKGAAQVSYTHSYTAYSDSLGKIFPDHAMIYEFEISPSLVGRLIGRFGSFVMQIKERTGANIIVKRHYRGARLKICAVEGVCHEIDEALLMIRERFPIKKFPEVTMAQLNYDSQITPVSFLPSNNKLNLIEEVINDIAVSCVVSLDHIFVQQPTHPTYPALSSLHQALKNLYDDPICPKLIRPFSPGVICVAQLKEDWFRCEAVAVTEEKEQVTARLVDVGGYVQVPMDSLRQIRMDFVTIPFQATECRLANVIPINKEEEEDEEGWSEEAVNFFKILAQGHVLQATVVGYSAKDNVTLIHLYKLDENHSHIFINEELINHGYGKWIEEPENYVLTTDELCQTFADLGGGPVSPYIDKPTMSPSWGDASSSDELASQEESSLLVENNNTTPTASDS